MTDKLCMHKELKGLKGVEGSWQSQRKSYTWKIELYCEFDAFSTVCIAQLCTLDSRKLKLYKVEVSEDRTQAGQNSL